MALTLQIQVKIPSDNFTFGLPICNASFFDTDDIAIDIDWGDGGGTESISGKSYMIAAFNSSVNGGENDYPGIGTNISHTYSSSGKKTIKIYGGFGTQSIDGTEKLAFPQRSKHDSSGNAEDFSGAASGGTPERIITIDSWSNFYVHGQGDFSGYSRLWKIPTTTPDFLYSDDASTEIELSSSGSATMLLDNTFKNASKFNCNLNSWTTGVSKSTSAQGTFDGSNFNRAIYKWRTHTGNITNFTRMLANCPFNKGVTSMDMSSATSVKEMFKDNTSFNQRIGKWFADGSGPYNITNLQGLFEGATSFNKYLKWDTSTVTNMGKMFKGATSYVKGVQHLDTSAVTYMAGFLQNTSFNKHLKNLDTSNVADLSDFLSGNTVFNKDISTLDVSKATSSDNFAPNVSSNKQPGTSSFGSNAIFGSDLGAQEGLASEDAVDFDDWFTVDAAYLDYLKETTDPNQLGFTYRFTAAESVTGDNSYPTFTESDLVEVHGDGSDYSQNGMSLWAWSQFNRDASHIDNINNPKAWSFIKLEKPMIDLGSGPGSIINGWDANGSSSSDEQIQIWEFVLKNTYTGTLRDMLNDRTSDLIHLKNFATFSPGQDAYGVHDNDLVQASFNFNRTYSDSAEDYEFAYKYKRRFDGWKHSSIEGNAMNFDTNTSNPQWTAGRAEGWPSLKWSVPANSYTAAADFIGSSVSPGYGDLDDHQIPALYRSFRNDSDTDYARWGAGAMLQSDNTLFGLLEDEVTVVDTSNSQNVNAWTAKHSPPSNDPTDWGSLQLGYLVVKRQYDGIVNNEANYNWYTISEKFIPLTVRGASFEDPLYTMTSAENGYPSPSSTYEVQYPFTATSSGDFGNHNTAHLT